MHTLPQANLTNPAVQSPCKIFVGMPLLSSVHFNYSNSYFSYKNVIATNDLGEVQFNPDYLLRNPNSRQQINMELHVSLLNFGYIYKNYYFNFNIQDKIDLGLAYPVNLIGLILKGNARFDEGYIGKTMDLNGLGLFTNYYREWAFGVSKKMDDDLTLGIKAKLLFGKANLNTSRSDLSLFTEDPIYNLNAQSKMEMEASPLILDIEPNGRLNSVKLPDASIASLLLNRKNKGLAFDFGFIYRYNEDITLSGSLLDLGFIRYKYFPAIVNGTGNISYTGIPYNSNLPTAFLADNMIDSFRSNIIFTNNSSPYTKFLNPKLYLGGTYDILDNANAGFMVRNELYYGKLRTSATASLNAWYKKYFTGSVSWSYINGSLLNFGLGLGARTPQAGLYVISDNVYGAFKYKSARLLNIRFGINFLFGCSQSSKKQALPCPVYDEQKPIESKPQKWKKKLDKESGLFSK